MSKNSEKELKKVTEIDLKKESKKTQKNNISTLLGLIKN